MIGPILARGKDESPRGGGGAGVSDDGGAGGGPGRREDGLGEGERGGEGYHSEGADEGEAGAAHGTRVVAVMRSGGSNIPIHVS